MIRQDFMVECVGWKVVVFYDADSICTDDIAMALTKAGCDDEGIDRALHNLDRMNSGFTYSNVDRKESVMVIGETSSAEEFANTYSHEKGHLLRHIGKELGIDPYGEEEQYVQGEIASKMFRVGKKFLCDNCRRSARTFYRVFMN